MNETWKVILNRLFVIACDMIDAGTSAKKLEKAITKEYLKSINELIEIRKVKVKYNGNYTFTPSIDVTLPDDVKEIINHEAEFGADLCSLIMQYIQEAQNG